MTEMYTLPVQSGLWRSKAVSGCVCRVLQQNMQCLGHLGHRTLQDLGLASATVSGGIHGHGRRGLPVLPAVMHASRRLVCVKEDTVTLEVRVSSTY